MNSKRTGTFTFKWSEEEEEMIRRKAAYLNWDISQLIKVACDYYPAARIKKLLTDGEAYEE